MTSFKMSSPRHMTSPPRRATSPPRRVAFDIDAFITKYKYTEKNTERRIMMTLFTEANNAVPGGIDLGVIDDRFIDNDRILHIPPVMIVVKNGFFNNKTSVINIDLSPLKHVTSIG